MVSVFENLQTYLSYDDLFYSPLGRRFYDRAIGRTLQLLNPKPGEMILDAGCGTGVHSIRIAQAGFRVLAIDISATALKEAERRARLAGVHDKITFIQADLTRLSFADGSFSSIFSWGVLIHIPAVEEALSSLVRLLKPQGKLALYLTNRGSWDNKLSTFIGKLRRRPHQFQQLPMGQGRWEKVPEGALWVWHMDLDAVTRFLHTRRLRQTQRFSGALTEMHVHTRGMFARLLLRTNNLWFRLGLPPGPAVCNTLIFEKSVSMEADRA